MQNLEYDRHNVFFKLVVLFLAISSIFVRMLIVRDIWNWYISAHFSLKEITFPIAFGISLLFCFLNVKESDMGSKSLTMNFDDQVSRLCVWYIVYLVVWGAAYLGTFFIKG